MKISSSYKVKFVVLNIICTILVSGIVAFFGVRGITSSAVESFSKRGEVIMEKASEIIEQNKQGFLKLTQTLDENDADYIKMNRELWNYKTLFECKFLYTMVQKSGNDFVYIVDGTDLVTDQSDGFSPIGTVEDISSYGIYPHKVMETKEFCTSELERQEDWGWMITCYMPITDNSGKSIGFVAADFAVADLRQSISTQTARMILAAVIGAVVAAAVFVAFILGFFRKINSVVGKMEEISGGGSDLTARIPSKGNNEISKLSNACNKVIETIQNMVKSIGGSVTNLSENSSQISAQGKEMTSMVASAQAELGTIEQKTGNQTELVSQISLEVENFKDSIETFNQKVQEQNESVARSSAAVDQISANIGSTDKSINRITSEYSEIVSDTNQNIENQKKNSAQIAKVVEMAKKLSEANKIISTIASQTNLLAMNAAIEAAHAGDSGKGFSVVAEEIRKLAETSGSQTKSIKGTINDIENAVSEMVSSSAVTEKAFVGLGEKVQSLQQSVQEIQRGMNEQAAGTEEILNMMKVLSENSTEMSATSQMMSQKTEKIVSGVSEISRSSDDILKSTGNAAEQLSQIKNFAEKSSESSLANEDAAASVKKIVESYKV